MVRLARRARPLPDGGDVDGLPPGDPGAARRGWRRVSSGRRGTLHAELGFRVDAGPDDRMLDPALGASALLDMGIYPLTFAHLMLGPAERADRDRRPVRPRHRPRHRDRRPLPRRRARDDDRVDDVVLLAQGRDRDRPRPDRPGGLPPPGRRRSSRRTSTARAAGCSSRASRSRCSAREPVIGQGYGNETAEVGRCLREGLRESPLVPHEQTLTLMRQMDDLRAPGRRQLP